jgi:Zn-dependent protease with chaperone function
MLVNSSQIQLAFPAPADRIPVTAGYRFRLLAVLLALVFLQILYLALVAGVVFLTGLYIVAASAFNISLNLVSIVIYLGPPAAGVVVTLFLLKPLFVRPPRPPKPLRLSPRDEPVLFEFVQALCRTLRAPAPAEIYVDLQVNAAASIRGWRGFFFGGLDLTIGLPLATGLSLPQFTGVLAHEFGHFAQRTGLRSYFLIQTIQNWFARVVHQRDTFDAWLDRQRNHGDWRIKLVALIADVAVKVSRKYLAILMKAGTWVSSAFSRQMEFDADRHAAAIAGCEPFEQTLRQLPLLDSGASLAYQDVLQDWVLGRLPDNIPTLVATRTQWLPDDVSARILGEVNSQVTARLDTHPCASDRIANMRSSQSQTSFPIDGPAERLFQDLPALCVSATRHHYRTVFKVEDDAAELIPTADVIANVQAQGDYERTAEQVLSAPPAFCARWFRLPSNEPEESPAQPIGDKPEFDAKVYDAALQTNLLHFAALMIARTGTPLKAEEFRLSDTGLTTIKQEEANSGTKLSVVADRYRAWAGPIAKRMENSTARLLRLGIGVRTPFPVAPPDPRAAWESYGALSQCQDQIFEIRRYDFAAQIVRANAGLIRAAECANLLSDLEETALAGIDRIVESTQSVATTVNLDPSVATTVGLQLKPRGGSNAERIQSFLWRVDALSARVLSQLGWLTIAAEQFEPESLQSVP